MKKVYGLLICSLLILGLFAVLALANVEDKIAKEGKLEDVDDDIDADEVAIVDNETDALVNATLNKTKAKKDFDREKSRVTQFEGFALSGEKGDPVRALWVSHVFERNGTNATRSAGRLEIGHGDEKSKFKLHLKEITDTSISFHVFPIDASLERVEKEGIGNSSVGTIALNYKQYTNIVVWKGTLVLNEGKHLGSWDITGWSRTRTIHRKDIEEHREGAMMKMQRKIADAEEKLNKTRGKVLEKIEKAKERGNEIVEKVQNKGEEQIQKAEQKMERARRWWEFWKR